MILNDWLSKSMNIIANEFDAELIIKFLLADEIF